MGKDGVIKTLGKGIGNVVLHSLLVKHTNRPESINHLQNEESEYRDNVIKKAKIYNWNEADKEEMNKIAIKFILDKKEQRYIDVDFTLDEINKLVSAEIEKLRL